MAGFASVLLTAAVVATLYYFDAHPVAGMVDPGGLVDVLFMPLVVTLAIGVGSLPALLSTRLLVYGGQISFSIYMVHEMVHAAWNWCVEQYHLVMPKSVEKLVFVGLVAVVVLAAMALFHFVEEPARRWMRRMIDFRDVRTDDRRDAPPSNLQSIDGAREARSARAV